MIAPRESGFTVSTPHPLYWAKWGPVGAPTLLVLHGGPGAHHDYLLPQMLELADSYEMVFYDQRGGGKSRTTIQEPITWRDQVDDLRRVSDELVGPRPSLIGYSWGGLLAMLFAVTTHDESPNHKPARMVLIDPASATREHRRAFEREFAIRQDSEWVRSERAALAASGLRERDPDAYRQRGFELSVAGYFAHPERARNLTPFRVTSRVQQSVWESLGDFDLLPRLREVAIPTMVIHGREDPIPVESSRAVADALGGRLVVLDDCGHVPYVEAPSLLFSAVRSFLGETAHHVAE